MTRTIDNINVGRLIAFLLTDGGITKTHYNRPGSWRIFFASEENFLLQIYTEIIEQLFGRQNWKTAESIKTPSKYFNKTDVGD